MNEVKILRLTTGEDVIAKVGENDQGVSLNKAFVIIPQQSAPGQPIQLMMSLYNAFGKSDTITLSKDKIVFMTDPKDDILKYAIEKWGDKFPEQDYADAACVALYSVKENRNGST